LQEWDGAQTTSGSDLIPEMTTIKRGKGGGGGRGRGSQKQTKALRQR
jgi:hypothetical protein